MRPYQMFTSFSDIGGRFANECHPAGHRTMKKAPGQFRRKQKRLHRHAKRRRETKAETVTAKTASDDLFDSNVGIGAQQVDIPLLAGLPFGPDDDRGTVHHPVGSALCLDFIGDHRIVLAFEALEHRIDELLLRGREDDHRPPPPQSAENQRQHLQSEQRQRGSRSGHDVHVRPCGQTDTRRGPEARRGSQPPYQLPVNDDRAGPDETDAADHLRRDAAGVEAQPVVGRQKVLEPVLRDNHHQRTAQRHQEMGAETRILDPVFAVKADDRPAEARHTQPHDKIPFHLHKHFGLRPAKFIQQIPTSLRADSGRRIRLRETQPPERFGSIQIYEKIGPLQNRTAQDSPPPKVSLRHQI